MRDILSKAIGIWFVILITAILNGLFREKVLLPAIGETLALPISGILLAALVFLVTLLLVTFIGSSESKTYIGVGALWVMLTLSFEFLFGHFVMGKSWQEIFQAFDIMQGDLFILVLFASFISPWATAKLRGVI
jgi:hypothetical protein